MSLSDVSLRFEFPSLQPSLDMLIHKKSGPVQASVYLPKDYQPRKKMPACIFLNGFTGGEASHAGSVKSIVGDRGHISINLPLFKSKVARLKKDESNYWMRAFIEDKDYKAIWAAYRVILKRIYEAVPNIDVSRTAMGGFSNGAHITAVLLNNPRCRVYDYVSHFYFIEGGCYFRRTKALDHRSVLIYQGADWEKPWLADAMAAAQANDSANVSVDFMQGVEHKFPDAYKRKLKRWLKALPAYKKPR